VAINAGGLFAVPWSGVHVAGTVAQKSRKAGFSGQKSRFFHPVEQENSRLMIQQAESGARSRHVIF
jgi:hypothetical protein